MLHKYTAVVEKCPDTGLYVGYVPGLPGAHSQGDTLDELRRNLVEVIEMLLEDGEPNILALFLLVALRSMALSLTGNATWKDRTLDRVAVRWF